MPVIVDAELVCLSQEQFATVAYEFMHHAFQIHSELGPLFDEKIYQNALLSRMDNLQEEVKITVTFNDFVKVYYMDLIASSGALFELKTVECLTNRHRGQMQNYLLLTGLRHGKLINFRSSQVQHVFVNNSRADVDRTCFSVADSKWLAVDGFGKEEKSFVIDLLHDWGGGLSLALYEEAVAHYFGGPDQVFGDIDVRLHDVVIGKQSIFMCAKRTGLRLTAYEKDVAEHFQDMMCLFNNTNLDYIQWINIGKDELRFTTLH